MVMQKTVSTKSIPFMMPGKVDLRLYGIYHPGKKSGEGQESKGKGKERQGKRSTLVAQVLMYILGLETRALRDITIKDMCRQMRINPSFLSRKFHEESHCTLCEFILRVKIQRAVLLLWQDVAEGTGAEVGQGKAWSVTAISEHLGFSSTEYFIRCFKQRMGLPPNQYRKCMHSHGCNPPAGFFL